jgi:hypothetical protein
MQSLTSIVNILYVHVSSDVKKSLHAGNAVNKFFENVPKFKYFGTTLTNHNYNHKEILKRINSGNACYLAVPYRLSSSLINKNVKLKIKKIYNCTCCFVWV